MRRTIILVSIVLASLWTVSLAAQNTVTLRFEILKNGAQISQPTVTVSDHETGVLDVRDVARLSFTPARIDGERVSLSLNVVTSDKTFAPRLVLKNQEPGSLTWRSSGSDTFDVRITLGR